MLTSLFDIPASTMNRVAAGGGKGQECSGQEEECEACFGFHTLLIASEPQPGRIGIEKI